MENIIKKLFHSYKKQSDLNKKQSDLNFARIKLDFSQKYRIEEIIFKDGRKRYLPQRSDNYPRWAGEDYCTIIFCKCEIEQYKYTGKFNTVDNNGHPTWLCHKKKRNYRLIEKSYICGSTIIHKIMNFIDILNLTKKKQLVTMTSLFEVIMILFLDYIFLNQIGVDVSEKFFFSWHRFLLNIFTPEFFLLVFGILIIYLTYYFFFPIFLSLIVFRIVYFPLATFLMVIDLIFSVIPKKLYGMIRGEEIKIDFNPSLKKMLAFTKHISIDENNQIIKGEKFTALIDIHHALSITDGIYEFLVRCLAFTSTALLILIIYDINIMLSILVFSIWMFSFVLWFVFCILLIRIEDLNKIILEAR